MTELRPGENVNLFKIIPLLIRARTKPFGDFSLILSTLIIDSCISLLTVFLDFRLTLYSFATESKS